MEVVSSRHKDSLVWSSGEEPEGWSREDAGEGKLAVGEVCLLGKTGARGKDPGQSSGWGLMGRWRREEEREREGPVGGAGREVGGSLGLRMGPRGHVLGRESEWSVVWHNAEELRHMRPKGEVTTDILVQCWAVVRSQKLGEVGGDGGSEWGRCFQQLLGRGWRWG